MFEVAETIVNATLIVSVIYTDRHDEDHVVTQDYARNDPTAYEFFKVQALAECERFNAALADPQPMSTHNGAETGIAFIIEGEVIIPVGEVGYFNKCDKCVVCNSGAVRCSSLPWCYASSIAKFNRYFVEA